MGTRNLRIGLDSNVFKNRKFLEWLRHTEKFEIHISVIVYVETLLWYLKIGLKDNDFKDDLKKLKVEVADLNESLASLVAKNAKKYSKKFPFRHHARDYVIGTTAQLKKATLITYNLNHFEWLRDLRINVMSPEEFILEHFYP